MSTSQEEERPMVVIKFCLLGDHQVGQTTFLLKLNLDLNCGDVGTCGVEFAEKTTHLKNVDVVMSAWNVNARSQNFSIAFPVACRRTKAILFCFDLTNMNSLFAIKKWYLQARELNKDFVPFLIGMKYDLMTKKTVFHWIIYIKLQKPHDNLLIKWARIRHSFIAHRLNLGI